MGAVYVSPGVYVRKRDSKVYAANRYRVPDALGAIITTRGTPGTVWRNGTHIPSDSLGVNGDYYLVNDSGDVYKRISGAYIYECNIKGANGINGLNGASGSVWRNGAGAPSNSLGVNGDYYLNDTNGDVYKRIGGIYSLQTNIKGADGSSGSTIIREDIVFTSSSLTAGSSQQSTVAIDKSYLLLKIITDKPARVRLYSTAAAQSADLSRPVETEVTPGEGVLFECVTALGLLTINLGPLTNGCNLETTPTTNAFITVTNNSVTTQAIEVTLTVIKLGV